MKCTKTSHISLISNRIALYSLVTHRPIICQTDLVKSFGEPDKTQKCHSRFTVHVHQIIYRNILTSIGLETTKSLYSNIQYRLNKS